MQPTPLTEIRLPDRAVTEMVAMNVDKWITNHTVTVDRQWWADTLTGADLADSVLGDVMSLGEIITLAVKAADDPDAALTLLWNSLAWGSGRRNRNNRKRIASVAEDTGRASELLMQAAELSHTSPLQAFELLYPRHGPPVQNPR